MKVTLVAKTEMTGAGDHRVRELGIIDMPNYTHPGEQEASSLAEFAGRLCYRAWSKPNPETATNEGYLRNIIEHKHFSVLEHGSVTFLFEGVSRNLTHELVRHRHFSFSQVSGRYVDQGDDPIIVPQDVMDLLDLDDVRQSEVHDAIFFARNAYEGVLASLKEAGLPKKKAQQAARFILPGSLSTDIMVSGNHRSWREFVDKRYSEFADPEIRKLAGIVLQELKAIEPNIYQDFEEKDFTGKEGVVK